ncbi:hypothetical protein E2C01_040137 [Portunus trituberculatus]|uniref:Uncharacterized protein n=1 Tax=Portunus trituberculatus TaxID=210409 RepID=A0A5B7FN62_PORTR|nr:hypothetical protein [Portunus trituberculatus]
MKGYVAVWLRDCETEYGWLTTTKTTNTTTTTTNTTTTTTITTITTTTTPRHPRLPHTPRPPLYIPVNHTLPQRRVLGITTPGRSCPA